MEVLGRQSSRPEDSLAVADPDTTTAVPSQSFSFPTRKRYLIVFIVSWNCLVITFLSTSVFVATPEIAHDLSTTAEILNVVNSGVIVAMGFSPFIWCPVANVVGRRRSYNAAIFVTCLASIGTALAPTFEVFSFMRIASGLTGTYFMVAGQTIIADVFEPTRRGKAVGCMQVGSVAGTAIGKLSWLTAVHS